MSIQGKLHFRVVKAKLTSYDLESNLSTFARISYNGVHYDTVVKVEEGQNPSFNQEFVINIDDVKD